MAMNPDTKRVATYGFWGFVAGCLVLAVVGFKMGGWYTGAQAQQYANEQSEAKVQQALVPICAAAFMRQGDASAQLAVLKAADDSDRGNMVEKLVKIPGQNSFSYRLKSDCADLLLAPKTAQK